MNPSFAHTQRSALGVQPRGSPGKELGEKITVPSTKKAHPVHVAPPCATRRWKGAPTAWAYDSQCCMDGSDVWDGQSSVLRRTSVKRDVTGSRSTEEKLVMMRRLFEIDGIMTTFGGGDGGVGGVGGGEGGEGGGGGGGADGGGLGGKIAFDEMATAPRLRSMTS